MRGSYTENLFRFTVQIQEFHVLSAKVLELLFVFQRIIDLRALCRPLLSAFLARSDSEVNEKVEGCLFKWALHLIKCLYGQCRHSKVDKLIGMGLTSN